MRSIYIIRHAKSSWEDDELPDIMRPLNPRGKRASNTIGRYLAKMHERPDLIISSPASRAYHTAIAIAKILGYRMKDIIVDPTIYFEGEQGVFRALAAVNAVHQSVFIFGHEPTCSDVIYRLCGEMTGKFPTGSVFKVELDIDNWSDLDGARGKKVYFISPKDIKEYNKD